MWFPLSVGTLKPWPRSYREQPGPTRHLASLLTRLSPCKDLVGLTPTPVVSPLRLSNKTPETTGSHRCQRTRQTTITCHWMAQQITDHPLLFCGPSPMRWPDEYSPNISLHITSLPLKLCTFPKLPDSKSTQTLSHVRLEGMRVCYGSPSHYSQPSTVVLPHLSQLAPKNPEEEDGAAFSSFSLKSSARTSHPM